MELQWDLNETMELGLLVVKSQGVNNGETGGRLDGIILGIRTQRETEGPICEGKLK